MAKKNYYAVREGRQTGIFTTWDEAKQYVTGYSGAIYKGFGTLEEAEMYMGNGKTSSAANKGSESIAIDDPNSIKAYVDGSYSDSKQLYSCGVVMLQGNTVLHEFSKVDNNPIMLSMRNVSGEILGSVNAIRWAISNKYPQIEIFYDYEGIEKWATGDWKANKEGTKKYVEFIHQASQHINIIFNKVPAHSGVKYNEVADRLAALAIERA